MQNSDPVHVYIDAINDYNSEAAKAKQLIDGIAAVANALQYHLPDFLRLTYSLAIPMPAGASYRAAGARCNMSEWPDGAAIEAAMRQWHAAFMRAHEAWHQVPNQSRNGLRPPPQTFSTS